MRKPDKRWHTAPELWDKLKPIADENRHEPTEAEKELWKHLRKHLINGIKFRRQHCIGQFIVDFYCSKAKLVVEIDGAIHQYKKEEDKIRQEYLESHGLKVLRFTNEAVFNDVEKVIEYITKSLSGTF